LNVVSQSHQAVRPLVERHAVVHLLGPLAVFRVLSADVVRGGDAEQVAHHEDIFAPRKLPLEIGHVPVIDGILAADELNSTGTPALQHHAVETSVIIIGFLLNRMEELLFSEIGRIDLVVFELESLPAQNNALVGIEQGEHCRCS